MRVIVVEKIEHCAYHETFSAEVRTTTITMTDMLYHTFTTILGVYASVDLAREALENEKMKLIEQYGEKALDDENIEDNHTFYTFESRVLKLEGLDDEEGEDEGMTYKDLHEQAERKLKKVEIQKDYSNKLVCVGFSQHDCESHYECPFCGEHYGSWSLPINQPFKCRCGNFVWTD